MFVSDEDYKNIVKYVKLINHKIESESLVRLVKEINGKLNIAH